jgi:hypothetical protein
MKPVSRILVGVAVFLTIDATVYLITAHEFTGGTLLPATAISFFYLGWVLWRTTRRAQREIAKEEHPTEVGAVELEHVGPTIWPVGFAVAAVVLAVGLAVLPLLLIPGGIVFVASAVGWTMDVRGQHAHHDGRGSGAVSLGSEEPGP